MLLMGLFLLLLMTTVAVVMFVTRPSVSQKAVKGRLGEIIKKPADGDGDGFLELSSKETSTFSDLFLSRIEEYKFAEKLQLLIVHAGKEVSLGRLLLASLVSSLVVGLVAHHFIGLLYVVLPLAVLGVFLPYGILVFLKKRRLRKFNDALPDAIELMSRALRAGHSMGSSIEVIAEQTSEPLKGEFASCFQQQKFGIPFRDAMLSMGERVPSDDLHFLVTAILVQKETGGDLTDILDRTSALIRDRIRIQGEIRTHTAQGRLTGWILGLMPIGMLLILNVITPGYSDILFQDPMGQKLLMASGTFIIIGGLIIRKIVDIKV